MSSLEEIRSSRVDWRCASVDRQRSDPAVAVSTRAVVRRQQRVVHNVGRHVRWVQDDWPGRGRSTLGRTQEQAEHELRQAEPRSALLLRQEHHDQSARKALRVQVRLCRAGAVDAADRSVDGGRRRLRLQVLVWRTIHAGRLPSSSSPSPPASRHLGQVQPDDFRFRFPTAAASAVLVATGGGCCGCGRRLPMHIGSCCGRTLCCLSTASRRWTHCVTSDVILRLSSTSWMTRIYRVFILEQFGDNYVKRPPLTVYLAFLKSRWNPAQIFDGSPKSIRFRKTHQVEKRDAQCKVPFN